MIAFVRGKLAAIEEECLLIDNNGIGLAVFAPINFIRPLPAIGEEIFLYTHLQIREDAWTLFGFPQKEQLEVFRQVLNISGIGAKTALSILNTLSISAISAAVSANDHNAFCAVPGVGKKTAQRLTLELKDKVATAAFTEDLSSSSSSLNNDLLSALLQLGFSGTEARALALKASQNAPQEADTAALLKIALKLSANS